MELVILIRALSSSIRDRDTRNSIVLDRWGERIAVYSNDGVCTGHEAICGGVQCCGWLRRLLTYWISKPFRWVSGSTKGGVQAAIVSHCRLDLVGVRTKQRQRLR